MAVNVCITLVLAFGMAHADLHGKGFLEKRPKVHTDALRSELNGILSEVLGHGHGITKDQLSKINATLFPIFRSLPKNNRGRLSEPIMRYAMRRYFSYAHAWVVKGFEEHLDASNSSNAEESILQSKVPSFVRSALEQRFQHEGFSLEDIVSMIAAFESLAYNEVVKGVELSYYLNSIDSTGILTPSQLHEVMGSYLITEMLEGTSDRAQHMADKNNIHARYPNWDNAMTFLNDVSGSDGFARRTSANPFREQEFMFEDAVRMAGRISEEFGPWSSYECHDMKDLLSTKDIHETGRVKLSEFYKSSEEGAWQFLEPSAYLRQLGALDESSSYLGPQVIIPNYITGMSNCITSAPFFSICCLNECDSIYDHIEDEISTPNATLPQILAAVETLPSFPTMSESLTKKLEEIAAVDHGSIPIHGRLLAQWLHFAFPRDCPYPHAAGTIAPKTQMQWREEVGMEEESVTPEEVKQHMEARHSKMEPSPDAGTGMWTFEESIMEFSTPSDAQDASFTWFLRIACQIAIVMTFGPILVREAYKILFSGKKEDAKEYMI